MAVLSAAFIDEEMLSTYFLLLRGFGALRQNSDFITSATLAALS